MSEVNVIVRLDSRVVEKISTNGVGVLGLTLVDNEMFALLWQDDNQVAVYSTKNYRLLRYINVPGFEPYDVSDMTSSGRHKCLYMSDYNDNCIHRYELASCATSKWPVPGSPCGLSITPNCNLLVTCREPKKLVELSAESGECVHEIALHSHIGRPRYGLQLASGQVLVCHGGINDKLHRVCEVNDAGRVTRSYGLHCGPNDGQLNWPSHLVVDSDSQLYVADLINNRVVLLSATLDFVRYVSEKLSQPRRLCLDNTARRLYVGQFDSDVIVIQL